MRQGFHGKRKSRGPRTLSIRLFLLEIIGNDENGPRTTEIGTVNGFWPERNVRACVYRDFSAATTFPDAWLLIPFLNRSCLCRLRLAVLQYCPQLVESGTNDLEAVSEIGQ
jgi:hypothetical protein